MRKNRQARKELIMKELKKYKNVSVKKTSELMGVSEQYVRIGLQKERLPFGTAVQISEKQWTYHISPGLLAIYLTGKEGENNEKQQIFN
ncbi:MAG: hypothetical protein PHG03_00100 [Bacilli bacterium]|nr:hypothetical protein [Bacilli bacterium]MDD4794952.1 hypothetical protein [Bacilli bacterium]